jgi:hypothetical protein
MSYEAVPFSDEEKAKLSPFERAIIGQIAILGDQNARGVSREDRYHRRTHSDLGKGRSYHSDGRIEYDNLWQVHRLGVGSKELTYAHLPKTSYTPSPLTGFLAGMRGREDSMVGTISPADSEFFITEFDEVGAVARVVFHEADDAIHKHRISRFGENHGIGVNELTAPLGPIQIKNLLKVINNPQENIIALEGLVRLNSNERRLVARRHREHDRDTQEYHDRLEEIDRIHSTVVPSDTRYA